MRKADFIEIVDKAAEYIGREQEWFCCCALSTAHIVVLGGCPDDSWKLEGEFKETMRPLFELKQSAAWLNPPTSDMGHPHDRTLYRLMVLGFFKEYCLATKAYLKL
jgi:hypothetical protein